MTTITVPGGLIYIPSWTTSTNLGPLRTTAFPADCLLSLWDFNTNALGQPWTQMTQGCAISTCCPYGNFYTEPWAWMTSYYSPGVCPEQYRSCHGPYPPSALSSEPGETIAFCCPTNYNCPDTTGAFYAHCYSGLSSSTNVVVMDNIFNQKTLSTRSWTLSGNAPFYWQGAYPIQVRAKAMDFLPISTTADITSSITSSVLTTITSPIVTATQSQESKSSPQLSTGTIVGIVIATTLSTIGFALGVGFLIYRYLRKVRRGRNQMGSSYPGIEGHSYNP
ncbi:hypothetical protein TWF694_011020 [Orbilia ellipsospora]|uniref:Uncharacterized protein n=1 Tax=Orbilia ellipsospora TaxID=2528407 RepID=A0AAV9X866_9PEZI